MNGNIIGEPIVKSIDDQINHRQQIHGAGYIPATPKIQRTPEVQNYLNNRNAWIKMASGVSLSGSFAIKKIEAISNDEGSYITDPEIANIQGQGLAENIVLFNSTQRFDNVSDSYVKRSGVREGNTLKGSIDKMYGGLGSNQRGLQPVPGITDISIDCLNRGSIRKATVNIKAYNKFQFGLIELLYLRLGYMVMLEWGWDKYINNITDGSDAITPPTIDIQKMGSTIIENQWFDGNTYSQSDMLNLVSANEERFKGNYGGFFGKVSNFQWKLNSDNTYDITVNLITLGSVIESLNIKIPIINLDKNAILERKQTLSKILGLNLNEKEIEESDNIILTNVGSDRLSQWVTDTIINWDKIKSLGSRKKNYIFGPDLTGVDTSGNKYITKWKDKVPKESRYFVRFETFLQVLQEKAIINVVNGPTSSDKELEFELDVNKVRCNYQTNLVPLNANKVLFSVLMDEQTLEGINGGNNTDSRNKGEPISYFNARLAEFATKEKDVIYGKLLNCYLNLTFIQQSFDSSENDKGEVSLFNFLGNICKGINESTGNCTNLEVVVKNDKTVVIIDQNQIKGGDVLTEKDDDKTEINIYGYKSDGSSSFVKDFDFQTKITPDLANMVTIGATASDDKDINSIPFKKWNLGLVNRFGNTQKYSIIPPPTKEEISDTDFKNAFSKAITNKNADYSSGVGYKFKYGNITIKRVWASGVSWVSNRNLDAKNEILLSNGLNKYKIKLKEYNNIWEIGNPNSNILSNEAEAENNYIVYLTKAFGGDSGLTLGKMKEFDSTLKITKTKIQTSRVDGLYFSWDNNDFINQGKNSFKKYLSNKSKEEASRLNPIISGTGFIPVELGITMDGITGIKIYNKLKINTKFLPGSYPENLKFIVKGVNHKISNNVWDTKISTISVPVSINPPTQATFSKSTVITPSFITATATPITDVQQKNNIRVVATYLKDAGVTREGALGLIGNLLGESKLNPSIVETVRNDAGYQTSAAIGGKGGFGIAQWTGQNAGGRRLKLETAAGKNLAKRDSLNFQTEYLINELKTRYFNVFKQLKSSNNIEQSTIKVLEEFEVPGSYVAFKNDPNTTNTSIYNRTKSKRIALALRAIEDVDKIYNT